ncbi:hypothetical protein EAL2_808p05620 (plasmid) [Peptoclostridium acidaminophilum DSM 3953]|uniref:DUF4342 domain-containing protein n=1 Tax=Peptoclostridium acidaminophilum DSM 3953 TaxID=1286171 RepID=W8TB24_PEPAC|nr:DUF4342 domain-containing protein [Peptoclostridium acidaminophilum]AHM58065.1 hypothetical protein EAL2_808p05620 [Peptoclostridium acidaminophilum DSM 3953]
MSVSLEKIDILKERANVSYQEAREALENTGGDLVEALIYLEKNEKLKKQSQPIGQKLSEQGVGLGQRIKDTVRTLHSYRFIIQKNGENLLNIPSTIAIIAGLMTFPMSIVLLVVIALLGCKIKVRKTGGSEIDLRSKFDEAFKVEKENKPNH